VTAQRTHYSGLYEAPAHGSVQGQRRAPGGILVIMTTTGGEPASLADGTSPNPRLQADPSAAERDASSAVRQVCPYLASADGSWTSLQPTRDQRCRATVPDSLPTVRKQRTVCLVASHDRCPTFLAAREPAADPLRVSDPGGPDLWPDTRSTVMVLDPGRSRMPGAPLARTRAGGQALLVGLMVVALLVLVIARTAPSSGTGGSASPGPGSSVPGIAAAGPSGSPSSGGLGPSASPEPTPGGTAAGPSPSPGSSPAASPGPSASAIPTAIPVGTRHYTVKSHDTLSSIALAFATTVKKIQLANGISNPRLIRVGQVLVIP